MAPKIPKTTAPEQEKPIPQSITVDEFAAQVGNIRDELESQPWDPSSRSNDGALEEGRSTRTVVNPLPNGAGVKVEEDGKTKVILTKTENAPIKEASPGDTFTRTLYAEGGLSEGYLTNEARVVAMRQSLIMYRDDPMYRALIDGFTYFIIGKGIKFKARDEDPAVQQHLVDFWKENKMDGRDTEIVRRFLKYGEILIRYFKSGANGSLAKTPRVRLIPFWRLDAFTVDAQDPETYKSFKFTNFNPDGYGSGGTGGAAEPVPAEEIQYIPNSENEGGRGEPPFLVSMRGCKWYADFMLNRVTLSRYRTSFALFKKVDNSGPSKVSAVDSASANATKTGKNGQAEKRLPKAGTVVVHSANITYDWKSPDTGAVDGEKDGNGIRQYIAAGAMVPEFLLGDASQANQDNSLVADNPFVRKVEFYQDFFNDVFGEMFKRVIEQGIASGKLKKTSTETSLTESNWVMRRVRKALSALRIQEATKDGELETKKVVPTKLEVDIEWPTLIQKNEYEQAQTLQIDQAMGLASIETLRGKRGYDDAVEEKRIERDREQAQDASGLERDAEIDAADDEEDTGSGKKKPKTDTGDN